MGTKPNFAGAYSKANEILVKSSVISTFPFSPTALVKEQTPIVCRTYEKAQKYGLDMRDFGSESAVIMTMGGKYIIFYDESKPMTHVGFSILHEFGHSVNKHDFRKEDEETYKRYEVETNYFAAQLLMPEQLLRELQIRGIHITKSFLQNTFGVSEPAAEKRITTLARTNAEWYSRAEREFFKRGLDCAVKKLRPQTIIVYGTTPDAIFDEYRNAGIRIIQFDSDYMAAHRKAVGA